MTLNTPPPAPVLPNYEMSEDDSDSILGTRGERTLNTPPPAPVLPNYEMSEDGPSDGGPSDVPNTPHVATSQQLDHELGLEPLEIGLPKIFPLPKTVIIMNASGPGTAAKRRELIVDVVLSTKPNIILFQEFQWQGIRGPIWNGIPLPDHYVYTGHKEASIMYDRNFQLTSLPSSNLHAPLDDLIMKGKVYNFAPFPRSCIRLLETEPDKFKLLVVSWHGVHREMKNDEKKKQFQYLQVYLMELSKREDAAVLLGGDFNIEMSLIKDLVQPGFTLYPYTESPRREGKVIDYFIASEALDLTDVRYIDLKKIERSKDDTEDDTRTRDPYTLLDHDPIIAHVTRRKDKDPLEIRLLRAIITLLVSVITGRETS